MTDYTWPAELIPFGVSFYLQPHTGGSESPFSRVTKTYGLSAPRWIASMTFRCGDSIKWGTTNAALMGQRMDAFLAKLQGRQNRVLFGDFRRDHMSSPVWPATPGNSSEALGATSMTVTGLQPGTAIMAGDYIGGDGRPHIVTDTVYASSAGSATVEFRPPLKTAIAANAAIFGNPTGRFMLISDDAGNNPSSVGDLVQYQLDFVEDL